jgi:hypothetical protein
MKKILGTVLAAALLAGVMPAGAFGERAAVVSAATEINGHTYLTESSDYRLYLNEEDLSLVMENKETGAFMESSISYDDGNNNATWLGAMKSAVVITIINNNDDTKQADLVNDDVKKTITYTDNGFSADLYWTKYQFGVTLEVSLTDEGLVARVPEESIREDGNQYYIGTLSLYPYMGNSYLDDKEGYLLVPDGNGALIYLDDKEGRFKSGYSGMIYGSDVGFDELNVVTLLWERYNTISDAEQTIAPVFGVAHTDDKLAYLGIVEDGAERASIEVIPNGVSVDYNRTYAKFILRKLYTQPTSNNSTSGSLHTYEADRSHSDLQVRWKFLSGDRANYAGMAGAYREYLLANGGLTQQDTSYNTRIDFLGTERQSWVIGTSAVVMTTVDDIYEIYDDLQAANVTDVLSVYKGWQKGGLYNLPISSYNADSAIGGTSDLTKLIKDSADRGIDLYLYNNALIINPDEQNATFNVVKKVNKRRYEEETYQEVYKTLLYLTPMRSSYLLDKFAKSYTSKGVNNLAVAGVSNTMFTFTYSGTKYTRFETADQYREALGKLDEKTNLILERPAAYLWKNSEAFLDMPMYTSSYILEDESIPFLSIVLKGVMPVYSEYVNFEANKQEFFLKLVETGTYPSFYITKQDTSELIYTNSSDIYSSQYDAYKSTITEYDGELKALAAKTDGATITGHEILGGGVTKVTYSNGVRVYVNYGSAAQTVDGITIDSMSYEVIG